MTSLIYCVYMTSYWPLIMKNSSIYFFLVLAFNTLWHPTLRKHFVNNSTVNFCCCAFNLSSHPSYNVSLKTQKWIIDISNWKHMVLYYKICVDFFWLSHSIWIHPLKTWELWELLLPQAEIHRIKILSTEVIIQQLINTPSLFEVERAFRSLQHDPDWSWSFNSVMSFYMHLCRHSTKSPPFITSIDLFTRDFQSQVSNQLTWALP